MALAVNWLQFGYDEFGIAMHDTSSISQPFGFVGYTHDSVANTWYAQVREYSPQVGRFTSQDKIVGFAEAPFTQNQYVYCWNQPVDLVDLNGLYPELPYGHLDPTRYCQEAGVAHGSSVPIGANIDIGRELREIGDWFAGTWNGVTNFVTDTTLAIVNNITLEVEYGIGIAIASDKGIVRPEVGLTVNDTIDFNSCGVNANNWGIDTGLGLRGSGGLDNIGVGLGWKYLDGEHKYHLGLLLPNNTDFAFTNIDSTGGDFKLSFGGRIYFGFGGGARVSFNFSEFWRQFREGEVGFGEGCE